MDASFDEVTMAYGYDKGFIIKYVSPGKEHGERKSCRNCAHANMEDKSCDVAHVVFWDDGYGNWKWCNNYIRTGSDANNKKNNRELENNKNPLRSAASRRKPGPVKRKRKINVRIHI